MVTSRYRYRWLSHAVALRQCLSLSLRLSVYPAVGVMAAAYMCVRCRRVAGAGDGSDGTALCACSFPLLIPSARYFRITIGIEDVGDPTWIQGRPFLRGIRGGDAWRRRVSWSPDPDEIILFRSLFPDGLRVRYVRHSDCVGSTPAFTITTEAQDKERMLRDEAFTFRMRVGATYAYNSRRWTLQ